MVSSFSKETNEEMRVNLNKGGKAMEIWRDSKLGILMFTISLEVEITLSTVIRLRYSLNSRVFPRMDVLKGSRRTHGEEDHSLRKKAVISIESLTEILDIARFRLCEHWFMCSLLYSFGNRLLQRWDMCGIFQILDFALFVDVSGFCSGFFVRIEITGVVGGSKRISRVIKLQVLQSLTASCGDALIVRGVRYGLDLESS
ncbi:hypothetical protein Tco_1232075 [Tanacetum coccineum]